MNPLLVSGIASIGSKIVNSVLGDNSATKAVKEGFDQELGKALGSKESELLNFLKQENVSSLGDLERLDQRLITELKAHPAIAEKLSNLGPNDQIQLKVEDEMITIEGPEGKILSIPTDSPEGKLARQIHDLRSLKLTQEEHPYKSLSEIVEMIEAQPIRSASWSINPLAGLSV